eukprot:403343353
MLQELKPKQYSRKEYLPNLSSIKSVRPEFLEYLIDVEGGVFAEIYDSQLGAFQTIGIGHKLQNNDSNLTDITVEQCFKLLENDIANAEKTVIQKLKDKNQDYYSLTQIQKEMLIDFAFNLGPTFYLKNHEFVEAVVNNNVEQMKQNYKRTFQIKIDGWKVYKPMVDRNEKFATLFGLS